MVPNSNLEKPSSPAVDEKCYPYKNLVGCLMYLSVATRPDIAYATSVLSQFNSNHEKEYWEAAKRVLRYLKGTLNHGLVYKRAGADLAGYVDADWGNCPRNRRSYTGFVFKVADAAVTWEARKQKTVALSSTEAEYMAMSEATKEAMYLQNLLEELGTPREPIVLHNDNQGAIELVKNPVFHSQTKHIDVKHHFIRDAFEDGRIRPVYMETERMVADIFTKGLPRPKHKLCTCELGIFELASF